MKTRSFFRAIALVFFFLSFSVAASSTEIYVNSTTGNDISTCGQTASAPCKTIKMALSTYTDGQATLRIAQGTYAEDEMYLPATSSGLIDLTLEGGWNDDFSEQDCTMPSHLQTASLTSGGTWKTFIHAWISGSQTAQYTFHCLDFSKGSSSDIPRLFSISGHENAQVSVAFDQVSASGFSSGAIFSIIGYDDSDVETSYNKCSFTGNFLEDDDGTLLSFSVSDNASYTADIANCRISDNGTLSTNNGMIYFHADTSGSLTAKVTNTIVADNSIGYNSHLTAFSEDTSEINLTLTNNTVVDNTIGTNSRDAAIFLLSYNSSTITAQMRNTIASNNHRDDQQRDVHVQQYGGSISFLSSHNIIGVMKESGGPSVTSVEVQATDPLLDSSAHLRSGSPAIDAGICGTSTLLIKYWRLAPYQDIDGQDRPGFGILEGCDIGADEYYAFPWLLYLPAFLRQ